MAREAATLSTTDFDTKHLEIRKLELREAIGKPFEVTIDVVVTGAEGLPLDNVAGAEIAVTIDDGVSQPREIRCLVVSVEDRMETEVEIHTYRLHAAPLEHRLALVETVDIFLDMSVPDVIKKKLTLTGDEDRFETRLRGDYPQRDFIVQYRESDLSFVSRLAEHLGISLVFTDAGALRLIDDNSGFDEIEEPLQFRSRGEQIGVFALAATRSIMPSLYVVRDYNYRTPLTEIAGSHDVQDAYAGGVIEYGAHTKTPAESTALAKVRAEERLARHHVYSGESRLSQIGASRRGKIAGHPTAGDVTLLFTEVVHTLEQGTRASSPGADQAGYRNTFKAIDAAVAFRPQRTTPRPFVPGVLTGVVDSDGDREDIANIDEHGRYRIRFLFDTAGPGERKASHRVRMAQPHAGPGYGMHFPLNPGVEVLLSFVNGDPDRPIVVGAVPNPATASPVEMTSRKLNRIKTESGVLFEIGDNT
ncbi:MAG: type VI secretion system tip protein VgrG [Polyangiaceae bacterium]|nr:type VI secretion system tip protein VgrG [Polyangiaceae bacterium]